MIGWVLVIVGALNWGLMGAFEYNLVHALVGSWPTAERVVYVLVGLAAVMLVVGCRCKTCSSGSSEGSCCTKESK